MSTQADSRSNAAGFGKIPTTSVRRLTSRLSRSSGLVLQIFGQCNFGRRGGQVGFGVAEQLGDGRELLGEHVRVEINLGTDLGRAGLSEDRADGRGDHLGVTFGHLGQRVAHEMHAEPLPSRALEGRSDRVDQTAVRVADDQLDAGQTAVTQLAQELGPELLGLAVTDRAASTSRRPSALTPVAITTAWDTTRLFIRTLQ